MDIYAYDRHVKNRLVYEEIEKASLSGMRKKTNRQHGNRPKMNAVRFILSENATPTGHVSDGSCFCYYLLLSRILDTWREKQIERVYTNLFPKQFTAYGQYTITVKYLNFCFLRERRN